MSEVLETEKTLTLVSEVFNSTTLENGGEIFCFYPNKIQSTFGADLANGGSIGSLKTSSAI